MAIIALPPRQGGVYSSRFYDVQVLGSGVVSAVQVRLVQPCDLRTGHPDQPQTLPLQDSLGQLLAQPHGHQGVLRGREHVHGNEGARPLQTLQETEKSGVSNLIYTEREGKY